jgi:hypothetical protein
MIPPLALRGRFILKTWRASFNNYFLQSYCAKQNIIVYIVVYIRASHYEKPLNILPQRYNGFQEEEGS